MTQQRAEQAASMVVALATIAGAYFVMRTPSARRAAVQITRTALGGALTWFIAEARRAWDQSRTDLDLPRRPSSAVRPLERTPASRAVAESVGGPAARSVRSAREGPTSDPVVEEPAV